MNGSAERFYAGKQYAFGLGGSRIRIMDRQDGDVIVALLHRSEGGGRFLMIPCDERYPDMERRLLSHSPAQAKREALEMLRGAHSMDGFLSLGDGSGRGGNLHEEDAQDRHGWRTASMF